MAHQFASDHWQARVLWLLGEIAFEQGDDDGAIHLSDAALRARRIGDDDRYRSSLSSILERVLKYSEAGDIARAVRVCRMAVKVWREGDGHLMEEAVEAFEEVIASLGT